MTVAVFNKFSIGVYETSGQKMSDWTLVDNFEVEARQCGEARQKAMDIILAPAWAEELCFAGKITELYIHVADRSDASGINVSVLADDDDATHFDLLDDMSTRMADDADGEHADDPFDDLPLDQVDASDDLGPFEDMS